MPKGSIDRPKRVLLSIKNITEPSNPYVRLFVASIPSSFQLMSFSWKHALFTRYELFHIHWPELIFRAKNPVKRTVKQLLLLVLLLRCSLRRIPIVRTVHNESPHESEGWLEASLLRQVDRVTTHWIVMNTESRTPEGQPRYLVPHGDYRSWYALPDQNDVQDGSLIFFGEIRPYKNVSSLCKAFSSLTESSPDASLTIMGRPGDSELANELRAHARNSGRIDLRLEFVPDSDLIAAISSAHLVVLPYLRFHNSGAALLALSVGRPILVPDCLTSRELVDEFGDKYIKLFNGELTSGVLKSALDSARTSSLPRPSMPKRDWNRLGDKVADVYSRALSG